MEDNVENCSYVSHRKNQRLIKNGLPPPIWCSDCGYACRNAQSFKKCVEEQWQNFTHTSCMVPNAQSFDCSNTAELREMVGIRVSEEYIDSISEENL